MKNLSHNLYQFSMPGDPAFNANLNPRRAAKSVMLHGGADEDEAAAEAAKAAADAEDEKRFITRFNKVFHKAAAAREERLLKSMSDMMEKSLTSKMTDLQKALLEDTEHEPPEPAGATGRLSPQQLAEIAQAKKDAAEAKDAARKWQTAAEERDLSMSRAEERQAIQEALNGRVKPTLLPMVVDTLHKNVTRDPDTKSILWKGEDGELVPYKDGLEAWSKSDFAKEVAPPREVGGSGGRGAGDSARGGGPMTLEGLGGLIGGR